MHISNIKINMNKNIWMLVGVVGLVLVVGGVYSSMGTKEGMVREEMVVNTEKEMVAELPAETDSNVMPEKENTMMQQEVAVAMAGSYEAYAPEKIAKASSGDVVLFFHASWCPSCRGLNTSIEGSLGDIPAGVTILKTDYDTQTELKQKYGVTSQHTLVQVDQDGNMIKKWSGSPSLSRLLAEVK